MEKILIASNNKGKLEEIKEIFTDVELLTLKDVKCETEVEENENTFEGNSKKKAREISEITNLPCIADDSGLCIDALNGWPGVKTARCTGKESSKEGINKYILEKAKDLKNEQRRAKVVCVITYYFKGKCFIGRGEIKGKIVKESRGKNGFGFDPIFELEDGRTLAELSKEEKNKVSARKIALQKLKEQLYFE